MRGHLAPRDRQLNKIGKRPLGICFISNFKHLTQVILKKNTFEYFSIYLYGLNLGPLARGHPRPWDLPLNKTGKSPLGKCFKSNFKHLSQLVLKKKIFEYFSIYFYGLNLGPPGAGPSWILGPSFEHHW